MNLAHATRANQIAPVLAIISARHCRISRPDHSGMTFSSGARYVALTRIMRLSVRLAKPICERRPVDEMYFRETGTDYKWPGTLRWKSNKILKRTYVNTPAASLPRDKT